MGKAVFQLKLYLQKQAEGQILLVGCSLLTPGLEQSPWLSWKRKVVCTAEILWLLPHGNLAHPDREMGAVLKKLTHWTLA